jgi:signal transduction histidine kinase
MFKSKSTLRFKDEQTENKFYSIKQSEIVKNNPVFSFITICIALISNCIYLSRFSAYDQFILFRMSKFSAMINLIIHIIAFCLAVTLKKKTKLQNFINYMNYFLITFDISFLRFISVLIHGDENNYIIYYSAYMFEIIFRGCFFLWDMIYFLETLIMHVLILGVFLAFYLSVADVKLMYLHVISFFLMSMMLCIFSYVLSREKRKLFYVYQKSESQNNWYQNIYENMNTGLMKIKNKKIIYANRIIMETFYKFLGGNQNTKANRQNAKYQSEGSERNRFLSVNAVNEVKNHKYSKFFQNSNKQSDDGIKINLDEHSKMILNKLFINHGRDENENMVDKKDERLECYLNQLADEYKMFSEEFKNNNLKSMGIKLFNFSSSDTNEIQLEIFYRYFMDEEKSDCFEFIFNDVTRIKTIEEKNAEIKYKTLFLSKIAHEFKNPIISINELINDCEETLVKLEMKNEDLDLNLLTARGLSDYLLILIKDMDFLAKQNESENSEMEISSEEINLEEVTKFCESVCYGLLRKSNKHNQIEFELKKNIQSEKVLKTDEIKLKQILVNLISNSVKFTQAGKITLSIKEENEKIEFCVEDTGIGMKDEFKEELLEKAKNPHVKNMNENNKHGTGLGMFIIKKLAEKIGCGLNVESKENKGTKIVFVLDKILKPSESIITFNSAVPKNNQKSSSRSINDDGKNCIIIINDSKNSYCDNDDAMTVKLDNPSWMISNRKLNNTSTIITVDQSNSKKNTLFGMSSVDSMATRTGNESYLFASNKKNNQDCLNIIVVDDEKIVRQSTIRIIKRAADDLNISVNIIEASDGIETLFIIFKHFSSGVNVDCIISDETMNYMNGSISAEILQGLYEKIRIRKILFYIVSAYEKTFGHSQTIESFETKPLNSNIVRKILSKCKDYYPIKN